MVAILKIKLATKKALNSTQRNIEDKGDNNDNPSQSQAYESKTSRRTKTICNRKDEIRKRYISRV